MGHVPVVVASANDTFSRKKDDLDILPWTEVLKWYVTL
jgi:hypothetical protein